MSRYNSVRREFCVPQQTQIAPRTRRAFFRFLFWSLPVFAIGSFALAVMTANGGFGFIGHRDGVCISRGCVLLLRNEFFGDQAAIQSFIDEDVPRSLTWISHLTAHDVQGHPHWATCPPRYGSVIGYRWAQKHRTAMVCTQIVIPLWLVSLALGVPFLAVVALRLPRQVRAWLIPPDNMKRCSMCRYILYGCLSTRCPECGTSIA